MKFYPKYGSVLGKLKSSDTFPQSPIIRRQLVGEVPTNTMDYPDLDGPSFRQGVYYIIGEIKTTENYVN